MTGGGMDFLAVMAEVSVAIVGFSALISVLRGSTGLRGSFRTVANVGAGLIALLMCVVPLWLAGRFDETTIARLSSAVAGVAVGAFYLWNRYTDRRLTALDHPRQAGVAFVAGVTFLLAAEILLIATALGAFGDASLLWYNAALVLLLIFVGTVLAVAFTAKLAGDLRDAEAQHQQPADPDEV